MCCPHYSITCSKPGSGHRYVISSSTDFLSSDTAPTCSIIAVTYVLKFSYTVGKHLAEHCRAEYQKVPNFILWILAEMAIVACDIPEGMSAVYFIGMY